MAKNESIKPAAPEMEERRELAKSANYEVFQLAQVLRATIAAGEGSSVDTDLAMRGICTRLAHLSDIVAEFLSDEDELTSLTELRSRLGVNAQGAANG